MTHEQAIAEAVTSNAFLYHYTSVGTLERIIASRELWATHIHYLNDASEFTIGNRLLRSFLDVHAETDAGRAFREAIALPLVESPSVNVFVASFSESGDLLSQWRAYCPSSRGVSIGLERDLLQRAAGIQKFKLVKCTYDIDAQARDVAALAQASIEGYTQATTDAERATIVTDFAIHFAQLAASFKDASFAEEQEWRVVKVQEPDTRNIQFREGAATLLPYVKMRLPVDVGQRLRIRRIVVGPTPHGLLTRQAVARMVKSGYVLWGQITPSQTSYRPW